MSDEDLVGRARDAAAVRDWPTAHDLFTRADESGLVGPADLPLLAEVAYAAGHLDATIDAWERAHERAMGAGADVAAAGAAVRVAMHLLFDTALMAPVRGWLARADRLLEGREPSEAHAWAAVVRSYERLLSGDAAGGLELALRAVELGSRFAPAAAAIGRVAEARCLILTGHVREGLTALHEAGVAILSGELDPLSTGVVYCELVCALQALAQYDLAEEWTRAMERWARVSAIGTLHGRCRVHRAEILRLRGTCDEAETEAIGACEELRPYLRRELGWPLAELGRIRLHRGDFSGAEEAFVAAHEGGWDAQPGLAQVRLALGDVQAAAAQIRAALEHPSTIPSKELPPNTELRRAPLLAAAVEIEIAANELERARRAADELEHIAATFESKALTASAITARARAQLAAGDRLDARRSFEEAVRLWNEVGAPYEAAQARTGLARALQDAGHEDLAQLEHRAASAALDRIRAGAPAEPREPHAHAFHREADSWWLAFAGRGVRLRDRRGLRYIARLLAEPGRELHVLELAASEKGGTASELGDAGPLLDERAKSAYRRRLEEIEEDIASATAMSDLGRLEQARAEREFLLRELSRAVGLGGRDRRAGSASERARASVTRAVRQAIERIREHHAPLAEHLERTVRTGTRCAYVPDPEAAIDWWLGPD